MKKIYIQPQIKARAVKANTILAGSMEVQSSGSTGEQNAKSGNLSFGFDDDNEEDNY